MAFVGLVLLLSLTVQARGEYIKYKDPKQPINVRIRDLMGRMTLAEKIGQMAQLERAAVAPDLLRDYSVGSVLNGGGTPPLFTASPQEWVDIVNGLQNGSLSSRLGIPIIYGTDAVHGHNNVYQATIFPHNIGLGSTRQVHTTHLDGGKVRCLGED